MALTAVLATVLIGGMFGTLPGQALRAAVAVQPISALSIFFIALRISALSGGAVGWWPAFKATTLSTTLLYLLPSRLSELIKPVYLADRCGVTLTRGMALIAVERFLDITIVTMAIALAAILIASEELARALALWGGLTLAGILGCMLLLRWPDLTSRILSYLPWATVRKTLEALISDVRGTITPRPLILAILFGIAAWATSFIMVYTLLNMAGKIPLSPSAAFIVFLAGTIGLAIAVAPGGLGTYEAGVVMALKLNGYELTDALGLALILRIANLGFLPLMAAWVLFHDGLGLRAIIGKLRQLGQPDQDGAA